MKPIKELSSVPGTAELPADLRENLSPGPSPSPESTAGKSSEFCSQRDLGSNPIMSWANHFFELKFSHL